MQNISIKKMRVMLASVEEGSFTRASAKQNISQPATSIIIQDIETQAGCDLFERSGTSRKAILTKAGEHVANVFSRIVGEFDYEMSKVNDMISGRREVKEILIQNSFAAALSGRWVQSLFETFNGYNIKLSTCSRDEIVDRIQSRDACLGVVDGQESGVMSDYRYIASDRLVAVARPNGTDRKRRLTWEQMPQECIIYSGTNAETLKGVRQLLADNDDTERDHLEINNEELIATLVRETRMPAILPRVTAQSILAAGDLDCLEIDGPSIELPIGLMMPWGNLHKTNFMSLRAENVFPQLLS